MKIVAFSSIGEAEKVWRALEADGGLYVFQTYDWVATWYEHVGRHLALTPSIVLVSDEQETPLMILPLGIERKWGLRNLVWIPTTTADYRGPVLGRALDERLGPEAFKTLWHEVLRALPPFDVIDFKNQLAQQGRQANPFVQEQATAHAFETHNTCLTGDWESYYRGKAKSKTRERDRSKERRLRKLGEVEILRPTAAAEVTRVVAEMEKQKRAQYAAMGADDIFEIGGHDAFYRDMAIRFSDDDFIHLSALRLDDAILATHWGAFYQGRFYYLMLSYDAGETAKFSPGSILLRHLMQWCFAREADIFDFTIGDESYKFAWSENHLPLYRWMEGRTLKGKLFVAAKALALEARSLKRRLRRG